MRKLPFTVITSVILLLSASASYAQTTSAQLTGTVAYRERMALPSDAVIDVQLIDSSVTDIAAQTVAEALINAEGQQVPVAFTLTYDPAKIESAHRYSVRATIRSGDGMLMFSSTQAYPVLTHGAPSKANLLLHTVGHGAKPAAATKKSPAPTSEVTASTPPSSPPVASESAPPPTSAAPAANEPATTAGTPSAQEPEKPVAQAETVPADAGASKEAPSSPPAESASSSATPSAESSAATTPNEPTPAETAANSESSIRTAAPESTPTAPETKLPTPATTEQPAPSAEPAAKAPPEAPIEQPESKPAEAPPTRPEQTTPRPESKSEPTAATPEAKSTQPDAPLPEAPSATKRAELEASGMAADTEGESTSRPDRSAPNKAVTPLADTQWKLIQLNGQDVNIVLPQKPVTLAFSPEGRRIAGSGGCNSYLGLFTDDHGRLHLSPGNMTMMACADPAGTREKKFIAMLRSADGYHMSGDSLVLTSNGKTVAKFKNNQE